MENLEELSSRDHKGKKKVQRRKYFYSFYHRDVYIDVEIRT